MAAEATIAINNLEWRSDAVKAKSGQLLAVAYKNARISAFHISLLHDIKGLTVSMKELVDLLHEPEARTVLESASREDRAKIGATLRATSDKVSVTTARLRIAEFGSWKKMYMSRIVQLENVNRAFCAHSKAFRDQDAELLMFSKEDQDFLIDALSHPKEPSEDLCSVFARK